MKKRPAQPDRSVLGGVASAYVGSGLGRLRVIAADGLMRPSRAEFAAQSLPPRLAMDGGAGEAYDIQIGRWYGPRDLAANRQRRRHNTSHRNGSTRCSASNTEITYSAVSTHSRNRRYSSLDIRALAPAAPRGSRFSASPSIWSAYSMRARLSLSLEKSTRIDAKALCSASAAIRLSSSTVRSTISDRRRFSETCNCLKRRANLGRLAL